MLNRVLNETGKVRCGNVRTKRIRLTKGPVIIAGRGRNLGHERYKRRGYKNQIKGILFKGPEEI